MRKIQKFYPLVSILINNYNKQKFCEEALKSAISQNYKNLEVIFFDDNSQDDSLKEIKKYKSKYKKKIKIIENKTRGNVYSFNQMNGIKISLSKSKGEIICFMDSDDFFKKNKVKQIVNFFEKNPDQDIVFDNPIFFKNKKNQRSNLENYFLRENKWPRFPPTSCISVRKDNLKIVLDKIIIKKFEDLWFDFRISTFFSVNKNQFNFLRKDLTYYRQHNNNYDKKFKKFLNLKWWRRRSQAFEFVLFLNKSKYKKNVFSLDYLITKLMDKFFFIF